MTIPFNTKMNFYDILPITTVLLLGFTTAGKLETFIDFSDSPELLALSYSAKLIQYAYSQA